MSPRAAILLSLALLTPAVAAAQPRLEQARVGPGVLRPLFPVSADEKEVAVRAFLLDRTPVTNAQFLAFATAEPRWRRDRIAGLFAEPGYLTHWEGPLSPGERAPADAPVVRVSWFAARAYCAWRGARLPTENEWELAAAADAYADDARADPAFREQILRWYARPTPKVLGGVGRTPPNRWGVHDLHGLIWEWVLDFGGTVVNTDSRDGSPAEGAKFCGGGALAASDTGDYAGFMRLAFRSALQARYTTSNLGFRCAADAPGDAP